MYKVVMTKDGYTNIVTFMTPCAAVLCCVLQKFVSPRFGRKTGLTSYDRFINS